MCDQQLAPTLEFIYINVYIYIYSHIASSCERMCGGFVIPTRRNRPSGTLGSSRLKSSAREDFKSFP